VELIRSQATAAPSFWALWCQAYRRHLRGFGDGVTFSRLHDVYLQAGGTGGPYGAAEHPVPAARIAVDDRSQAGTINEPSGGSGPQTGQEGRRPSGPC